MFLKLLVFDWFYVRFHRSDPDVDVDDAEGGFSISGIGRHGLGLQSRISINRFLLVSPPI